jgi:glycerol-3-phosphate dehydrogenase
VDRASLFSRLISPDEPWDLVVIGGGASGVGVALDAASRGYRTALVEQHDFGKGTSGRSTKLVHGGVRYLEQGNISLVMEALRERGILKENAPHLVRELAFVVPNYEWWEAPFYGIGLRLYDLLAGKYGFGQSSNLSAEETLARLPTLRHEGLRGGVIYYDGQFDDTRLLIHMVITAVEQGAVLVNYCPVVSLIKSDEGLVAGVRVRDAEGGSEYDLPARAVVNATGAFCDQIRRMANPSVVPLIRPSQGIHLVFDRSFLAGDSAVMVPHTRDGRVMFAIPWHGRTLVGTTDTPIESVPLEPLPFEQEVSFILETARVYLDRPPSREDILSAWAGVRPLVGAGSATSTASLSRDHTIHIDHSGLVSIAGGKWTTYRHMAEDCVNQVALIAGLPDRPCVTRSLRIHGCHHHADGFGHLAVYGSDAVAIQDLMRSEPALGAPLHPALPYVAAEVAWAARSEMARTVEDVLSRRLRALMLDARAALEMAPAVASLLAAELGRSTAWRDSQLAEFAALAQGYLGRGGPSDRSGG